MAELVHPTAKVRCRTQVLSATWMIFEKDHPGPCSEQRLNFHTVFKEPETISRLKEIGRNVNVVLCGKTRRMKGA